MSNVGPMPYDDDKMPFYALGTNLAMQVGGQGNLKNLLDEDELEIAIEGFCDIVFEELLLRTREQYWERTDRLSIGCYRSGRPTLSTG